MKKNFTILSLILIFALIFCNFSTSNVNIYAEEEQTQFITVLGKAEIEVSADNAELCFGIKNLVNTFQEGQQKINDFIDNFSVCVKEIDENANIYITYSSCHPVWQNGVQGYVYNCNIKVLTTCLDCIDKIINCASENGVSSFCGVKYKLNNKEETFNNALNLAKQNAQQKVNSMYNDNNLMELYEVNISTFNQGENGNLKICACVKAKYEVAQNETQDAQIKSEDVQESTSSFLKIF